MKQANTRSAANWASLLLPIEADDSIEFGKLGEEIDILIDAEASTGFTPTAPQANSTIRPKKSSTDPAMLAERCQKRACSSSSAPVSPIQ